MKKERIKIGWAEADITPAGKCELYGQYYQRVSKGVHSRLGATVLAMQSESGEQAIMISVDLIAVLPNRTTPAHDASHSVAGGPSSVVGSSSIELAKLSKA